MLDEEEVSPNLLILQRFPGTCNLVSKRLTLMSRPSLLLR